MECNLGIYQATFKGKSHLQKYVWEISIRVEFLTLSEEAIGVLPVPIRPRRTSALSGPNKSLDE